MRQKTLIQRLRPGRTTYAPVSISEKGRIRSLHLGSETVQSAMNLDHPGELVLSYSRAMMSWLLFCEKAPEHITQIGLGGGSFVRWIAEKLPHTRQSVIEINPEVIQIAHTQFGLPPQSPRFTLIEGDGAEIVRHIGTPESGGGSDVILVDGFDGEQIIDALVGETFFQDCKKVLKADGIFATNWWRRDRRYQKFVETLLEVFEGRVLEVPAATHGNMAVLAFKATPNETRWAALEKRALKYETEYGLEFPALLNALKKEYPLRGKGLEWA